MIGLFLKKYKHVIALVAILNLIPGLVAVTLQTISMKDVLYFYWFEWVFIFAAALFLGSFFVLMKNAKRLIAFLVMVVAAVFIVQSTYYNVSLGNLRILMTFWGLYGLSWVAYVNMGKSSFGLVLKRIHPLEQFFFYLLFMTLSIIGCFSVTASIYDIWGLVDSMPLYMRELFLAAAVIIPTLAIGFLKIIDMIGPRHFLWFLLGAYHRPVEQDRVVLYLDMVDSSTMAERLGPKQSMGLISRFIFDAMAIFRLHGGDVLSYTGDGLVVLWPRKGADRALAAVIALRDRLDQNSGVYQKEFGIVPDFRVGLHAGKMVIAQIGEEKLFLGPYGDVVNTASRLEKMNKELNTKVLISDALLPTLNRARQDSLQTLGKQHIRGKNEEIEIFTLREQAA